MSEGGEAKPARAVANVMMTEVPDEYTPGFLKRTADRLAGAFGGLDLGRAGFRGHQDLAKGGYACPTDGALVGFRDRKAKRHHPKGGHGRPA